MSEIYGWPYFDPEVVEAECFPIEHDIEYVGGVRVTRTVGGWRCGHGRKAATAEAAAANCVEYCPMRERGKIALDLLAMTIQPEEEGG